MLPRHAKLVGPFVLVAGLIAVRNPVALLRSEFWAEDALVFFPDALNAGWRSLYMPVYGYHFLLSRMIAWTATVLPVVAAPYVYAWASLAVSAAAIGYFSRETFTSVIPSYPSRVLACVLLVLAPGSGEVMMNLCNLMTPLTLLAFLLLLESPGHLGWRRFAVMLFLAASAGPVFLLTPVIAYLAARTGSVRHAALIGGMLPIFVANVVGNHVTGSQNGLLNYSYAVLVPMALAHNFVLRLAVLPIAGSGVTSSIMTSTTTVFWTVSIGAVLAIMAIWRSGLLSTRPARLLDDQIVVLLLLGFTSAVLTFGAIAVSRSYAIWQVLRQSGDPLWHMRYSFLPGTLAVLIWATLLYRLWYHGRAARTVAFVLLAALSVHELSQWRNVPLRRDVGWPYAAEAIQDAVDARRRGVLEHPVAAVVPVHPAYWNNGHVTVEIVPLWKRR